MKEYEFEVQYLDGSFRVITVLGFSYKDAYYTVLGKIHCYGLVSSISIIR